MTTIIDLPTLTIPELKDHIEFLRPFECDHDHRGIEYLYLPYQIELAHQLMEVLAQTDFSTLESGSRGCHDMLREAVQYAIDYGNRPAIEQS